MDVISVTVVGISIVFLSFVMLFILFKVLAFIFSDRKKEAVSVGTAVEIRSGDKPIIMKSEKETINQDEESELIAVISASISCYGSGNFSIREIREVGNSSSDWKRHTDKTWRKKSKGETKRW